MALLWVAIVFFILWILEWIFKGVNTGFWFLLGLAVAFLIVHLWVRSSARARSSTPNS
jgi:hypothetical protein